MTRLAGKIAVVSGVSEASGKAVALLFAREGARVVAVDRSRKEAEETCRLITSEGGECLTYQADVTREAEAQAALSATLTTHGRVDILINNLDLDEAGGPAGMETATWHRVLDTNLTGAFLMCKHAIPSMQHEGGAIVNVSSIAAVRWGDGSSMAYGASKAGLNQLSRSVALHHAPSKVRCNAVLAGLIAPQLQPHQPTPSTQVPMGRLGDAWDIAEACLFLASDEAAFITAAELVVDGGFSATMVAPFGS